MKRVLYVLTFIILTIMLIGTFNAYAIPTKNGDSKESTYIVLLKSSTSKEDTIKALEGLGCKVVKYLENIGVVIVKSKDPRFIVKAKLLDFVEDVGFDVKLKLIDNFMVKPLKNEEVEADLYYNYSWNLRIINADDAWEITTGSKSVRVAILDTGVDFTHEDLARNYDREFSRSFVPPEVEIEFLDIDASEYIPTMDYHGHGTYVAGIVAASGRVLGVAPNVKIVNVKVISAEGYGYLSWIIRGLYYVAEERFNVASMSFGGYLDLSDPSHTVAYLALSRATFYAYTRGVLLVAAIGNDALDLDTVRPWVIVPAEIPYVVAVSAVGPVYPPPWPEEPPELPLNAIDVTFASYSNYGSSVDITAPGGDFTRYPADGWWLDMVLSTWSSHSWFLPASYVFAAGTSVSTPHISGTIALIRSVNPTLGPLMVKMILYTTAVDKGTPGFDKKYGYGLVNVYDAVLKAEMLKLKH